MNEYLTFFLCAPMSAFGSYAGHERRGSATSPHRSAILGLIGAALGVDRKDSGAQMALRQYRFAVQSRTENKHLRDYHTVQTAHRRFKRPASRRVALEAAGRKAETTITYRDYRTDVAFAVAIWLEGEAWPLSQVANALKKPEFVLYAGRKSCPLSAPMTPKIVRASDPKEAVCGVTTPEWLPNVSLGQIISDPFDSGCPDRVESGPVEPTDRSLWHFAQAEIWYFDRIIDS